LVNTLASPNNPISHVARVGRASLPGDNSPDVIRHQPGGGVGVAGEAGNQVQVQMGSTLSEGDGINPITARELLDQSAGVLHG
jgi:hypothetical protein